MCGVSGGGGRLGGREGAQEEEGSFAEIADVFDVEEGAGGGKDGLLVVEVSILFGLEVAGAGFEVERGR